MLRIDFVKFRDNLDLRDTLLATYPQKIRETSPTDYYFGTGKGSGQNKAGIILMAIRAYF